METIKNQIKIILDDITTLNTDAIVNAANNTLLGGGGVDGAIHKAAGKELLSECKSLKWCETGEAKITKGYNLKAKYIIHTVGPVFTNNKQDGTDLTNCYINSLNLVKQYDLNSVAFCAIATGTYGYPLHLATHIAFNTIINWIKTNNWKGNIILCCYDQLTYDSYLKEYQLHFKS